jgi:tetratricopeptide (TPR) repeat protein
VSQPNDPLPLLEMMLLLMLQGQGRVACVVLKKALQILFDAEMQEKREQDDHHDDHHRSSYPTAITILLAHRMFASYEQSYSNILSLVALADLFPDSPVILSHVAIHLYGLKYSEQAEMLFISALMLDPNYDVALLYYARLLMDKSNYKVALRYLSRVEEGSRFYYTAQYDYVCIHELIDAKFDLLYFTYKGCIQRIDEQKDRLYSCFLHNLAHLYQRCDDVDKAVSFYQQALTYNANDVIALLLSSSLDTMIAVTKGTTLGSNITTTTTATSRKYSSPPSASSLLLPYQSKRYEIDARYRTGLLLSPRYNSSYCWIATLGYADYVCYVMRDIDRAEKYYIEASNMPSSPLSSSPSSLSSSSSSPSSPSLLSSSSHGVWASVALSQFYQYTKGDISSAGQVLLMALRRYRSDSSITSLLNYMHDHMSTDDHRGTNYHHQQHHQHQQPHHHHLPSRPSSSQSNRIDEDSLDMHVDDSNSAIISLYTMISFHLLELQQYTKAATYAEAVLYINPSYAPALRSLAIISWHCKPTKHLSHQYFESSVAKAPFDPYVLRSCAMMKAMSGEYHEAIEVLNAAIAVDHSCSLSHKTLAMMKYLYQGGDIEAACTHLDHSFYLSSYHDTECLRLKAQLLMGTNNRYKEARVLLQQLLYAHPIDPIAIASLAHCISMIPNKVDRADKANRGHQQQQPTRSLVDIDLMKLLKTDVQQALQYIDDMIHCRDPSVLFTIALKLYFKSYSQSKEHGSQQMIFSDTNHQPATMMGMGMGMGMGAINEGSSVVLEHFASIDINNDRGKDHHHRGGGGEEERVNTHSDAKESSEVFMNSNSNSYEHDDNHEKLSFIYYHYAIYLLQQHRNNNYQGNDNNNSSNSSSDDDDGSSNVSIAQAMLLLHKVIDLSDNYSQYRLRCLSWSRLGDMYADIDDLSASEDCYMHAIQHQPNDLLILKQIELRLQSHIKGINVKLTIVESRHKLSTRYPSSSSHRNRSNNNNNNMINKNRKMMRDKQNVITTTAVSTTYSSNAVDSITSNPSSFYVQPDEPMHSDANINTFRELNNALFHHHNDFNDDNDDNAGDEMVHDDTPSADKHHQFLLLYYQKRLLMYRRVEEVLSMTKHTHLNRTRHGDHGRRKTNVSNAQHPTTASSITNMKGTSMLNAHIFLSTTWLDDAFQSFSTCEDWGWLIHHHQLPLIRGRNSYNNNNTSSCNHNYEAATTAIHVDDNDDIGGRGRVYDDRMITTTTTTIAESKHGVKGRVDATANATTIVHTHTINEIKNMKKKKQKMMTMEGKTMVNMDLNKMTKQVVDINDDDDDDGDEEQAALDRSNEGALQPRSDDGKIHSIKATANSRNSSRMIGSRGRVITSNSAKDLKPHKPTRTYSYL